jgi:E3 ubiquitin-protein ligase HUWE1
VDARVLLRYLSYDVRIKSTVDLVENGRNIEVTDANKSEYVLLVCENRMSTAIKPQLQAFLQGFHELVKPELISVFSPKEIELLISGVPTIDLTDLKMNTDLHGYKQSDPQIQWFWNALWSFSEEDRVLFVQFVTGSAKVPLEGFASLMGMRGIQKPNVHRAYGSDALPTAHTCFNQLDLPEYKTEVELKEKLLMAIREGSVG